MKEFSQLSDFDIFFFYGQSDLELENESDLIAGLLQPRRSLYYNRQDGCGISEKENYPLSLSLQIGMRYDVANWVAFRNTQVTDGSANTVDRRIAVSQNSVSFRQDMNKGTIDLSVVYIPFGNFRKPDQILTSIGRGI